MSEKLEPKGYSLDHLEDAPEEKIVLANNAVLFQRKEGKELYDLETIIEKIELEVDTMANNPEDISENEWKGVLKLRDKLVEEVFG